MGWPSVTMNVLAYNRREALRTTLAEILALDYPPHRLEVVVVDNASDDATGAILPARREVMSRP